MTLTPGTRLGPYQIVAAIGAGGMGEVYKAHDTKLDRDVAIKILPQAFVSDPERVVRFQREAKTLASLNHPNIGGIYGLEEGGGVSALVMELVEGEDLAQRITRGSIPLDEALPIAKQIAEALEAAHEQGIVHRDLKPANIKVRADGTVKVLDFGLAKALDSVASAQNVSESPTITTPAMMTGVGMILGTAAYMSPEQARGKIVDKRADIWAFGCVLYEMLTSRRAFGAEDVSLTLAEVIKSEPDWAQLPSLPGPLEAFLRQSLRKDPRQRVQSIGDMRLALEGAFDTGGSPAGALVNAPQWRHAALLAAAAVLAGAVVVPTLIWVATRKAAQVPPRVARLPIASAPTATLTIDSTNTDVAMTPDGSRLVYVGNTGTQLFVRDLDALEPLAVFTGTPRGPFVSPDGQWIGFVDGTNSLKKVAVTGGPAITLATLDGASRGATWGPEDSIIIATSNGITGLQSVSAGAAPTTVLTRPDRAQGEADHFWPEWLPGGRAVLFTITASRGGLEAAQVAVFDVATGTRRVLLRGGSHAHYVPSGHLVYAAAGALRAVPFDLAGLETRGTHVTVVPDVVTKFTGGVDAVVAEDGTLAYVLGVRGAGLQRTLVWVDRQGRETPIPTPPRAYAYPRVSPDGTRVAVMTTDQEVDLWVWDARTGLTRATFDPAQDLYPVWTRDGQRVIFSSERTGVRNLFWQAADGTGTSEQLTESPHAQNATAVTPDGQRLIFTESSPETSEDLMQMTLDGTRRVTPLVQSPFAEQNGVVSPDGHWLAYEANDSGRFEIYVRPFPDVKSGHWLVSTVGGTRPLWARSGRELFYVSPTGALVRVEVARGPSWVATPPTRVVKEGFVTSPIGNPGRSYDVATDAQRFLIVKEVGGADQTATTGIVIVLNWTQELKRLVPTK